MADMAKVERIAALVRVIDKGGDMAAWWMAGRVREPLYTPKEQAVRAGLHAAAWARSAFSAYSQLVRELESA